MKKVIRLNENDLKKIVEAVLREQTLASVNNMAMVNNIAYKLKVWMGGILGYQPVQIKGLKLNPDGSAELSWVFSSAVANEKGTDTISKEDVKRIMADLNSKGETKWELQNGKTVKLVKAN